jgi:AcrR family transcriptional regulator
MGIAERKEREKLKMRGLILNEAMRLSLGEGFEKVTIRRIAERIEYSPATIYLHFKDKDDILFALHREGFEELYKRQQAILTIKDPLKRLRRHGEMYLSFALEKPEYYDLMFIKRNPVRNIREQKEWDIGFRSYDFLRKNVEECMKARQLPRTDADVAAFSLWAHVHGIASLIIRDRCIMFPEEHLKSIVKGALDFMMGAALKRIK